MSPIKNANNFQGMYHAYCFVLTVCCCKREVNLLYIKILWVKHKTLVSAVQTIQCVSYRNLITD